MRYAAWIGFAVVAITYTVLHVLDLEREQRERLIALMKPYREAFRSRYVAEEFMVDDG